jgi:hypothetical protein
MVATPSGGAPPAATAGRVRPTEPLYELRKRLRLEYIARIAPQPEEVRRFLDQQVPAFGTKEARFMELLTVEEFLAFDAARRYALTGEIPREVARCFSFEPAPHTPPHDSEWVRCTNFVVRRAGGASRIGSTRAL